VERFLGGNQKLIDFIYSHPDATAFIRKTYQNITNWEQTYHSSGDASIKILFDAEGQSYGGGFEMTTVNQQINTGRMWVIRFIY
jgi:hypothetical protein